MPEIEGQREGRCSDVGLPGGMNGQRLADAGTALRGMHVLTKPFSMDMLANRITNILSGQRA